MLKKRGAEEIKQNGHYYKMFLEKVSAEELDEI